ncbi:MAG: hypothetical protein IH599_08250, partial [Bacteroidales bacterium]|nr:hypothetical protein [Bacteroidales bacterium]
MVALNGQVVALAADSSAYLVSPGAAGPVILDTLKEAGLDWLDGATDQSRQIYVHATSLGDFTQLRAYQVGPAGFVERGSLDIDGRVSDMTINDSLLMVCSNHALADTNTGMLRVFVLPDTGGIQMYPVFPPYLEKGTYYTSIAAEWPEIFIGANDGQSIMDANTFAISFQPTYRPILDLAPTTLFSTTVACGNPALMTLSPPAGGMMGELPGSYTEDTLAIPWPDNYDFPGDSNWAYDIPPLPDTLNIHGEAYFFLEDTVIHEKSAVQVSIAAVGHSPGKFVPDTSLVADDEPVRTMNGGFLAVVDSAQTYTVGNLIGGTAWVDANTARWFGGGVYVRNGGDTICIGDYIDGYAGNHTLRNYFLGNTGRWGGAVALGEHSAQPVKITNNIIGGGGPREGNLARSRGGGIYAQGSRLEIRMNSILGNFAVFDTASVDTAFGFGGGLAILGSSAVVENNWVARNRSAGNAGGVGIITGGGPLSLLH